MLYVALVETVEERLHGADSRFWLDRLEAEHDNLRAAGVASARSTLRWSREQQELDVGLRIAGAIWRFWFLRGHLDEGRAVLRQLLLLGGDSILVPIGVRAKVLNAAGAMAFFQTHHLEAVRNYEVCLALRRQPAASVLGPMGDEGKVGSVLSNLGLVMKDRGEHERAAQLFEESLAIARRWDNKSSAAHVVGNLGILAQERGEYERARVLHEECLALKRELREHTGVITTLNNLGAIAVERGQRERARSLLEESLSLARELGAKRSASAALINLGHVNRKQDRTHAAMRCYREGLLLTQEQGEKATMAMSLEGLAAVLAVVLHTVLAVTLFGAADGLRRSVGVPLIPAEASEYETILDTARQELGEEFEPAWATGRSTSIDGILVLALEQPVAGV